MSLSRLFCTLLALLSMTAAVNVPAAAVLCVAQDHVAVESAATAGECRDDSSPGGPATDGAIADAAGCVDTDVRTATPDRPVSAAAAATLLAPAKVVAVLPAMLPGRFARADRDGIGRPPAHLLPLRSFVLLA